MMKITRASEYAIRCIYFVAKKGPGLTVKKSEISREMNIPEKFLTKIAQQLACAGLLSIVQGPKGGIKLTDDPKNITMLEVVEAIMGELFINECIQHSNSCKRIPYCKIHMVWNKAQQELKKILGSASFNDLINEECCID